MGALDTSGAREAALGRIPGELPGKPKHFYLLPGISPWTCAWGRKGGVQATAALRVTPAQEVDHLRDRQTHTL